MVTYQNFVDPPSYEPVTFLTPPPDGLKLFRPPSMLLNGTFVLNTIMYHQDFVKCINAVTLIKFNDMSNIKITSMRRLFSLSSVYTYDQRLTRAQKSSSAFGRMLRSAVNIRTCLPQKLEDFSFFKVHLCNLEHYFYQIQGNLPSIFKKYNYYAHD